VYPIKILYIFQPHLFDRAEILRDDFYKSLSAFDESDSIGYYLPTRELPMEELFNG
jgi:UDP-N-acetylmuramate-alanine ligase